MRYSKFPARKKKCQTDPNSDNVENVENVENVNKVDGVGKVKELKITQPRKKHPQSNPGKYSENQKIPNMGNFQKRIIKLLVEAKTPLSPESIAKRLKKSRDFVFVWLTSVGKGVPEIKRVPKGQYKYEEKTQNSPLSKQPAKK
jgi:hypothetical protein